MQSTSALLLILAVASPRSAQEPASHETTTSSSETVAREDVGLLDSTFALKLAEDFEAGALLRAYWAYADGDIGNDLNGFNFYDVDIWAEMVLEDFEFRVNFDASSGTAVLEDGFAKWNYSESLALQFGNFKPRANFSTAIDPDHMILNDRTILGTAFDVWDLGAQASGTAIENLDYFVSVTNGSNGPADDTLLVVRGEYGVYGEELPLQEGNRNLDEDTEEILFGATYYSDTGNDDVGFGADVLVHWGNLGGHAEFMRFGDGLSRTASLPFINVNLNPDTSPFAVTAWYDLDPTLTAAARYQSTNNNQALDAISGGLTYYPEDLPMSVTADVHFYSDDNADGFALQVGLTVGHWRAQRD